MPSISERPIPWFSWDVLLNRMAEWLFVGSMIAALMPAIPGTISCFGLLIIFASQKRHQAHPLIGRYNDLRKKKNRDAAEEAELQGYESWTKRTRSSRPILPFMIGFFYWAGTIFYLIGVKGFMQHYWY